ncbi:MFS domain-containing protein [Fusarium falciforme]|uniref:MFS domain-containing protein n=1 Tax=Fusarium falciforme TaxID=195108 RepID=UPI002300F5A0|nr:MFS domain-containing protein [Fusarium falciforme]WAO91373.1 MFS domain-containing protein [Fusarium falciforme]
MADSRFPDNQRLEGEKLGSKVEDRQIESVHNEIQRVNIQEVQGRPPPFLSSSVAAFAIDGNIIGGMSALPAFREHFNVSTSGSAIALVFATMSIGNIVASLFQWLSDLIGRRGVTFIGNIILVISCILQAVALNRAVMIVGHVFGRVGCSLSATVDPLYMSEVAPSVHRGLAVGLYCSCYSIGSIVIACVLLGGSYMEGNWTWRMPMLFQLAPPVIVSILVYPCTPESPRYLIYKSKVNEAEQVIAKYHTDSGLVSDPIVAAEISQIQASIDSVDSTPLRLYDTVEQEERPQCSGTSMLAYYLLGILSLVRITNTQQQLGINVGMSVASWLSTLVGPVIVNRVRRRFLLMATMGVFIFFLSMMSLTGGLFDNGIAMKAMGILTITWICLFQISNGLLSLAKIEWEIYFIFIGIDSVCLYLTWRYFAEFQHLSLEEIDHIFETPGVHPVKISKALHPKSMKANNNA